MTATAEGEQLPHIEPVSMIRAPREACFDLSLSVDAHAASMGPSGERAVAGVTSGHLHLGDTVTWLGRHFGIPFRLTSTITSTITEYERPARFVDVQLRGPFASWHHEHLFEYVDASTTQMADRIDYRSPAGPVGVLVDRAVLAGYMRRLIERRNAYLVETLETKC